MGALFAVVLDDADMTLRVLGESRKGSWLTSTMSYAKGLLSFIKTSRSNEQTRAGIAISAFPSLVQQWVTSPDWWRKVPRIRRSSHRGDSQVVRVLCPPPYDSVLMSHTRGLFSRKLYKLNIGCSPFWTLKQVIFIQIEKDVPLEEVLPSYEGSEVFALDVVALSGQRYTNNSDNLGETRRERLYPEVFHFDVHNREFLLQLFLFVCCD